VAKWISEATGNDSEKRATAIAALAAAPRSEAIPVLERVLGVADAVERPLALRSLRTLARNEGDADQRIRSVVRKFVYHDSDEHVTQEAQATLDDIEHDLGQSTPNTNP
jgi:hypothetical protein